MIKVALVQAGDRRATRAACCYGLPGGQVGWKSSFRPVCGGPLTPLVAAGRAAGPGARCPVRADRGCAGDRERMVRKMGLETKSCVPCEAGTPPLGPKEIKEYVSQVGEWEVVGDAAVRRRFTFKNFREAMAFVNRVADIAETEGHHPDIKIVYNR
ncbi:MAG: 4a-hydroxytetrahydrobiopterin dehydratase, partial [Terriglobia bacterium]